MEFHSATMILSSAAHAATGRLARLSSWMLIRSLPPDCEGAALVYRSQLMTINQKPQQKATAPSLTKATVAWSSLVRPSLTIPR